MLLNFLATILKALLNPQKKEVKELPKEEPKKIENNMEIDWNNPEAKISKYFKVKEALLLPSWGILHIPSEEEKKNILEMAKKMDEIRELIGLPISVHCWGRPTSVNCPGSKFHGADYNAFVKGSKTSAHRSFKAVDWSAKGKTCDQSRAILEPKLEQLNIRMEYAPGTNWVHTDIDPASKSGGRRYFKV